eukprot:CAMPEP_0179084398 /NCGR_PEP_ID=MMETSP0796-20121207/38166_1 /TAXON_ID=73915 /ORGANISM="Pyrodinium bahamense, Strain pbaha01" /LENGTH=96 /DNA_ID=CAMNT_0020781821 /DNA_START=66 /DNA_END=352 /DNA_ORIENTATION=+
MRGLPSRGGNVRTAALPAQLADVHAQGGRQCTWAWLSCEPGLPDREEVEAGAVADTPPPHGSACPPPLSTSRRHADSHQQLRAGECCVRRGAANRA